MSASAGAPARIRGSAPSHQRAAPTSTTTGSTATMNCDFDTIATPKASPAATASAVPPVYQLRVQSHSPSATRAIAGVSASTWRPVRITPTSPNRRRGGHGQRHQQAGAGPAHLTAEPGDEDEQYGGEQRNRQPTRDDPQPERP